MKSSYLLLGAIWDRMRGCNKMIPKTRRDINDVENFEVEENLFDAEKYERKISLSTFLTCQNEVERKQLAEKITNCDIVYLVVDYSFKSLPPVIINFLKKRTSQVYFWLQKSLPEVKFYLSTMDP